jgi:hypothetical protein
LTPSGRAGVAISKSEFLRSLDATQQAQFIMENEKYFQ